MMDTNLKCSSQAIRNFAKSLESALAATAVGAPAPAARAQAAAAAALAAALRRYTSLNHLAQAARAVLTNHHQIQQVLEWPVSNVDFIAFYYLRTRSLHADYNIYLLS
jgi:hypothetical protein